MWIIFNYTWDANGNLLNDGTNTYSYDPANRLTAVSGQQSAISFGYNGLGDRLQQTFKNQTTNYSLDINTELPAVLADNSNNYIYGLGNLAQITPENTDYFIGDVLGSTRQLSDTAGAITLSKNYDPIEDLARFKWMSGVYYIYKYRLATSTSRTFSNLNPFFSYKEYGP